MVIVGIDPGLEGGIALLSGGDGWALPLPHNGKEVAVLQLLNMLGSPNDIDLVVVERLGVRPRQSTQSGATQGINHGRITGTLESHMYPLRLVRPQDWKAKVLRGTKKDKSDAIAFVQRAYPMIQLIPDRCRVPKDGMADAVCLAEFGRQLIGGG